MRLESEELRRRNVLQLRDVFANVNGERNVKGNTHARVHGVAGYLEAKDMQALQQFGVSRTRNANCNESER